jgi:hypothetical protein
MHRTADGQQLGDTLHDAQYRDLSPACVYEADIHDVTGAAGASGIGGLHCCHFD